jgi:ATP-dependent DNA helicase RecG
VVPGVIERVDEPLYPTEALREALANALCHRDYSITGGAVGVAIYDDRLEITSAGRLPTGMTLEDLTRPHPSRPWNPLIAQTFYRRGIIESWGRGTLKMTELTERAGLVPPEFEATGMDVLVRSVLSKKTSRRTVQDNLRALRVLDLVESTGRGAGARWGLKGTV